MQSFSLSSRLWRFMSHSGNQEEKKQTKILRHDAEDNVVVATTDSNNVLFF